jgi:hypothetical protein
MACGDRNRSIVKVRPVNSAISSYKTLPGSTSSTSVAKYKDVKSKIFYKPEEFNDEEINSIESERQKLF